VQLEKYDSISILRFMIYRFVKWKKELPRIESEIQSEIDQMSPDDVSNLVEDGFLDPSIDPSFRFDLEFPFPLTRKIHTELVESYKLHPFFPDRNEINPTWFFIMPGIESSIDGMYSTTHTYGVYQGVNPTANLSWAGGKLTTPGVKVLLEGEVTFGMKWALVTDENYSIQEAPISYLYKIGYLPIYHSDVEGADVPAISKAIVGYVCYKKILEWAKINLIK